MAYKTLGMLHSMLIKDCTTTGVPYMSEKDRERYRLSSGHGFLFMATGAGLNTSAGMNPQGRFLFVMDADGEIFAGPQQDVHHHSAFMSGRPVASAGVMEASNGTLRYINPESGHYSPPKDYFEQVLIELKKRKVNLDQCEVEYTFNATSSQIEKVLKRRGGGGTTIDQIQGVTTATGAPVTAGQHQTGQRLRLYPDSKPQWQWF